MKVLCISGSPRKGQNSETIIMKAREFFKGRGYEFEPVFLSEVDIGPCTHCDFCKKEPSCSIDDEANRINEKLAASDAVLLVTPVYFGGMTGQLKCLLDKTLPLRRDGMRLKGTAGAVIAVGGSRNGGQELTLQSVHAWMLVHGMVVVGDDSHFGGTVHNPLEEDGVGDETVRGTLGALDNLLQRLG